WTGGADATSYNVYRGTSSGAEGTAPIGTASSTSYSDTGLPNGVAYFYRVAAVNGGGTSALSGEAFATPQQATASTLLITQTGEVACRLYAIEQQGIEFVYDVPSITGSAVLQRFMTKRTARRPWSKAGQVRQERVI
ncbi:MAG: hypothetical protein ACLQVD_02520, partial [Capsulimonadaceae bacterium]